jgi:UDP-N-acetylmuramoylalanine--D-glutamate ligase
MDDLRGATVTVMGLGRFGGGLGVTRWLVGAGATVTVTDCLDADALAEPLRALADLVECGAVRLQLGGHDPAVFTSCDLVVANPAVPRPWANAHLESTRARGIPVTTEIGLLVARLDRAQVIGVTGSAGKSTTSAMIHHALRRALDDGRRAHLGGNIGGSLLPRLDEIGPRDPVVLELSSAMLHWLGPGPGATAGWSPAVAVVTNLAPNHLDWHGDEAHYAASKRLIAMSPPGADEDVLVIDGDAEGIGVFLDAPRRIVRAAPVATPPGVPGRHNLANAALASAAAALALDRAAEPGSALGARCAASLSDFRSLPHRLEALSTRGGVRFINDSKSTTPRATELAVAACGDPARVHLIAGGHDKQVELKPIAALANRIAGLYTIGTTGAALAHEGGDRALYCETLEHAVERAWPKLRAGDVLLLSPGCASWDQFENYEQRGAAFASLVREKSLPDSGAHG